MKQTNKNTVSLRILDLRRKHHLTQEEFAKRIFIHAVSVSQWERGLCAPSCELIILICNTFNVSADWLLGLKREERDNDSE